MTDFLHDNIIEGIIPTVSNEVVGFEGVNVTDWKTYTSWKAGVAAGTQDAVFDLGSAKVADYFAVYGHNLGSQGCSLSLRYSSDDIVYFDAVAEFVVTADGVIFKPFTSISRRYWNIRIINCTVDAVIGVAAIGVKTTLPDGLEFGFKPPIWEHLKSDVNVSVLGNFLGRTVIAEPQKIPIKLSFITEAFARGDLRDFILHAQRTAFFFSWDPVNHIDETVYAWIDEVIVSPVATNHNFLGMNFNIWALRD